MRFSVVVPAFNEEGSVEELCGEVSAVLNEVGGEYEIIFVDDGSTDSTPEVLRRLSLGNDSIRNIRFIRNFGKSAAYSAGFDAARGQIIITLDADLQDDPHEIPAFLAKLEEGFDLVGGWKIGRLENEPLKTLPSKIFNGLTHSIFGLKLRDINCGFRVMRKGVAKSLNLYGDLYRFIPILAHVQGYKVTEAGYHHRKRKHGKSKYGAKRFWTGLLDLLTVSFVTTYAQQRPLHFFGTVGLVPVLLGFLLEAYVLADRLFFGGNLQSHIAAIVVGVMLILIGFQCIITGLVGEMLTNRQRGKNYLTEEDR
ncbi:glycosyltransferase [Patescibacteria group bacterium]|nr:MAG: glycosyltransferase [Patescibacteria group bacterium]